LFPNSVSVSEAAMAFPAGPPRILLVEDNALTLLALSRLLQLRGYAVDTATTAAQATAAAEAHRHALVISDIELPDATGETLMGELRRRHGYAGIAVTGHDDEARLRGAAQCGFVRWFVKPVDVEEFLAAVDEAVAGQTGARRPYGPEVCVGLERN
jgi:DNA-binding response OmpR family regulator